MGAREREGGRETLLHVPTCQLKLSGEKKAKFFTKGGKESLPQTSGMTTRSHHGGKALTSPRVIRGDSSCV